MSWSWAQEKEPQKLKEKTSHIPWLPVLTLPIKKQSSTTMSKSPKVILAPEKTKE